MNNLRALAIGDRLTPELTEALGILERCLATLFVEDVESALRHLVGEEPPPDLLVLLQGRAGQFSAGDVLRLRARIPLARAVAVLGAWSEGETRSGRPLPSVRRVGWHQWPLRLARELAAWQAGSGGTWALPATASDEELLLAADAIAGAHDEQRDDHGNDKPIGVRSANSALAAAVVDYLRRDGLPATNCQQLGSPGDECAAVVDDLCLPLDVQALAADYARLRGRPIIALADFPRARDASRVRAAGAGLLLAKPVDFEELTGELRRLLAAATS